MLRISLPLNAIDHILSTGTCHLSKKAPKIAPPIELITALLHGASTAKQTIGVWLKQLLIARNKSTVRTPSNDVKKGGVIIY